MNENPNQFDTIILGGGAAGLMCAAEAGRHGGRVLVIDHAKVAAEKIRISGGGRCNFTNVNTQPQRFLSANPHFAKSALSRYTAQDFIALVNRYTLPFHEKTLGQLFCDSSAKDIIDMLHAERLSVGAKLWLQSELKSVEATPDGFRVRVDQQGATRRLSCRNFVVASGGKSIPKMGASGLGYQIAEQFGLGVTATHPALVPFRLSDADLARYAPLAGVSLPARVKCKKTSFDEALLFTHRGLSGPAILQISSYWRESQPITLALAPNIAVAGILTSARQAGDGRKLSNVIADFLPNRLAALIAEQVGNPGMANLGDKSIAKVEQEINHRQIWPVGTEGYRTAEVTLGGVDTTGLSSKTMAARDVPGLYFIGEVVDVTGWLGGYNFQWAWSSGWVAGQTIAADQQN